MDPTNRNTALASAMAEELARCGVREAVICPGSRSTPLALALWRESAINARVIVDERSAGFFALGAAQASASPVVMLCTSGTAAANFHPAVCEADESAVPLIVLTADRPPELRGIGAGQTIDQIKLYGSSVRWFCEVGTHDADDAGLLHHRSVACRAFWTAAGDPRPGPVHLNVPWRDPLGLERAPADVTAKSPLALAGRDGRPLTTVPPAPPQAAPVLVEALAERLRASRRGLVVAGRMATGTAHAAAIARLARVTGFPILAEPTSQLRLGHHDRELVISAYDPIARARPETLEPDLVLRFGELPTCKPLRQWLADLPDAAQLVIDPLGGWYEPTRIAGAIVRAHPVPLCEALADAVAELDPDPGWARAWRDASDHAERAIAAELEQLDEATEPGLHAALGRAYSDGDLVYTASSMPIRDQEAFLGGGETDVTFFANRGANGIDGLVSGGVGAAAATGRPTWIVTGDVGLFHDMNGLATARGAGAPVRIVVINNGGGGIFDFLPQAEQIEPADFEALMGTPPGVDLERVAAVHDLRYERLADPARLREIAGQDVVLIEVPVPERKRNVELHRRITDAAVAALEGRAAA